MSKVILEDNEIASAANNLHDLLDVICLIQFEPADEVDRRVDSLLWIARDLSESIKSALVNTPSSSAEYIMGLMTPSNTDLDLLSEISAVTAKFHRIRQDVEGASK
jgi:hypothetical protein